MKPRNKKKKIFQEDLPTPDKAKNLKNSQESIFDISKMPSENTKNKIITKKPEKKTITVKKERSRSNGAIKRFTEHNNKLLGNLTSSNVDPENRQNGESYSNSTASNNNAIEPDQIKVISPTELIPEVKINNEDENYFDMDLETIPIHEMVEPRAKMAADNFL